MRLWVEILFRRFSQLEFSSASSWGCELKYRDGQDTENNLRVSLFVRLWVEMSPSTVLKLSLYRQPLREAVSWNDGISTKSQMLDVSLFVRLWVEIFSICCIMFKKESASSWGCELKWFGGYSDWSRYSVSLFVRLWVEIILPLMQKYLNSCQPLREAVSWNELCVI